MVRRHRPSSLLLFLLPSAATGACGVFALNDVVPETDASPGDGGRVHDGGRDGHDADAADAARALEGGDGGTEADAPGCDAADPCSCLPKTLMTVPVVGGVRGIAADGTNVYWLAGSGSSSGLYTLPAGASSAAPVEILKPTGIGNNDEVPIHSGFFYFEVGNTMPYLARTSLGSEAGVERLTATLPTPPLTVRVNGTGVYWTDSNAEVCFAHFDGGMGAPRDSGCGDKPLVRAVPDASAGGILALSDAEAFVAVGKSSEIVAGPLAGGAPRPIVTDAPNTRHLAATAAGIVWAESVTFKDSGAIFSAQADGGAQSMLVATSPITAMLVDGGFVYYVVGGANGQIYRVPVAGGPSTLMACDDGYPYAIAADATNLYWGDSFSGQVWRTPK